jgi:stalled ribosome rescue protein Dom34
VLAGDPRTIDTLDGVLRHGGLITSTIDANLEGLRTDEALGRLEEALRARATQTSLDRVRAIEEANGACGLARVLAVLNEGRVASLLIDPSRTYVGLVEPGEILRAADRAEGAADLTDLIVSRALSTGAGVIPVLGDAAERLGSHGGIAALLRW